MGGRFADRLRACGLAVVLWLSTGCAGSDATRIPPERKAIEAGQVRVERSVEAGMRRSDDQDSYTVEVRLNPGRCEGPPFEVRIHGRWTRVYLEGAGAAKQAARTVRSRLESASPAATLTLQGRLGGRRVGPHDVRYPVFEVHALEGGG